MPYLRRLKRRFQGVSSSLDLVVFRYPPYSELPEIDPSSWNIYPRRRGSSHACLGMEYAIGCNARNEPGMSVRFGDREPRCIFAV